MAKLAEEDKTEERYRPISEDTQCSGLPSNVKWTQMKDEKNGEKYYKPNYSEQVLKAWSSKVVGDLQTYTKGEGAVSYAVNVIQSMRWPGAVTVSKGGKFCSLYVGDGQKRGDTCFNPIEPPTILMEPNDAVNE